MLYPKTIPSLQNIKVLSVLILFLFVMTGTSYGQMFSVGDTNQEETRPLGSYTNFAISWEFADLEYQGDELSVEDRADFQSNVIRVQLENPGLHVSIGAGGKLTGMDDTSYLNMNAMLFNDTPIVRSEGFRLSIPIQIITDLKRAQANQSSIEFQQSSLIFGTGLSSSIRIAERVDFQARATPNYGFSFSQGNLFGGSLFRTNGKLRLFFNEIIGQNSLSVGYDFDYRNYNIEGDQNDYQYLSHSFSVGFAF